MSSLQEPDPLKQPFSPNALRNGTTLTLKLGMLYQFIFSKR